MEKAKLTSNQLRAISCILESSSIEEAAKKAKISRASIYNWLKDEKFSKKLKTERDFLFSEGLNLLMQANMKAVKELVDLLDSNEEKTRRLAAKEILNMSLRVAEIRNLEERISKIEAIVKEENNHNKRRIKY